MGSTCRESFQDHGQISMIMDEKSRCHERLWMKSNKKLPFSFILVVHGMLGTCFVSFSFTSAVGIVDCLCFPS